MIDSSDILVIAADERELNMLAHLLEQLRHQPMIVRQSEYAISTIRRLKPDLIIADILFAEIDGYRFLNVLKRRTYLAQIPILVVASLDGANSIARCLDNGADDYVMRPLHRTLLQTRIAALLRKKIFTDREAGYRQKIKDYSLSLAEQISRQIEEVSSAQLGTIFALAKLAESRDPQTGQHIRRICEYCRIIAEQLQLSEKYHALIDADFIENIYHAASLHDIGKVGIPDRILQKPSPLTPHEFDIMKTHTEIGAQTLREVVRMHPGNNFLQLGIDIAEAHHERWDGTGYPHGLIGEEIPLAGRILALGDVYDALTSKRCYKDAFPHEESCDIVLAGRGGHFDEDVVDAFVSAEDAFIAVKKNCFESGVQVVSWDSRIDFETRISEPATP